MGHYETVQLSGVDQARFKVLVDRKGNGLLSTAEQEELKALALKLRMVK